MALTRKFLAALGLEAEKVDEIITAHTETIEGLKTELAAEKAKTEKIPALQKQLEDVQADIKAKYVSKEDHEKTVKEFSDYKNGIAAKEAKSAKEAAVRAYYEGKGIKDSNLTIAMRGSAKEIEAIELDEKGAIKDTKVLDALTGEGGEYASLITANSGGRVNTGGDLSGRGKSQPQSRATQLYEQHYQALYGAKKGTGD